jgi:hypothetical protein
MNIQSNNFMKFALINIFTMLNLSVFAAEITLVRFGPIGEEKPGIIDAQNQIRDLSSVIADITPQLQTVPGQSDQGSVLDATNPMDLMNRLRRANAMNDATPPADAIDAALKALETSQPAP